MRFKYKLGLLVTVLLMALCLMTYQSYALWIVSLHGDEENVVEIGCFEISFVELPNNSTEEETIVHKNINLTNTYPMSDTKGLTNTPYAFKIKNTCSINSKYHVTLNTPNTNTLDDQYIKYALYKSEETNLEKNKPTEGEPLNEAEENTKTEDLTTENLHFEKDNLANSYLLDSGVLKQNEEVTYSLILWMSEGAKNDQMGKKFEASVNVITVATSEPEVEEQTTPFPGVIADSYDETGSGLVTQEHGEDETFPEGDEGFRTSELRFVGSEPNNYIWFNCDAGFFSGEEHCRRWRIIGLVNVKTTNGIEQRIKIVDTQQIGHRNYSWDSSAANVNDGNGVNEWSQSDVMKLLNPGYENEEIGGSLFWNLDKTDGKCYAGVNNSFDSCNVAKSAMKMESEKYISDDIIWNTGTNGNNDFTEDTNGSPKHFYAYERSKNTGKICSRSNPECNDNVTRKTTWQTEGEKKALIGLVYPSDIGYSVGGGAENRENCLESTIYNWDSISSCYLKLWLKYGDSWTMMPAASSESASYVFYYNSTGYVGPNNVNTGPFTIYATLYLKANVQIKTDGDSGNTEPNGSIKHPFILTIEQE